MNKFILSLLLISKSLILNAFIQLPDISNDDPFVKPYFIACTGFKPSSISLTESVKLRLCKRRLHSTTFQLNPTLKQKDVILNLMELLAKKEERR